MDATRSCGGPRRPAASGLTWDAAAVVSRPAGRPARALAPGRRSLWLSRAGLDASTRGRRHPLGLRCLVPSRPRQPPPPSHPLASSKARTTGVPARRRGHGPLAARDLAGHQQRAQARQQAIFFREESGFYPVPSVVRTSAPVGQTPIRRGWWTRDHLSAISAISPEAKRYFSCQDRPITSQDVVASLAPLLREVPSRMLILWDGAPIHRSRIVKAFLTKGMAERLQLERLPAYAPELNPDEGLWARLKGVELRNPCCFDLLHLHHELRAAVTRVRRKPRVIKGFFRGAKL